jgi:hypothetical protein
MSQSKMFPTSQFFKLYGFFPLCVLKCNTLHFPTSLFLLDQNFKICFRDLERSEEMTALLAEIPFDCYTAFF